MNPTPSYFARFRAKAPSEIHQPNQFAETVKQSKELGYYEEAIKELEPVPFAVSHRFTYLLARLYANAYHLASALLGLACIYLIVNVFVGFEQMPKGIPPALLGLMAVLVGAMLVLLLAGLEVVKGNLANSVFRNKVIGYKNSVWAMLTLSVLMLASILLSAVGGAVISLKTGDRTALIQENFQHLSDSLQRNYLPKIQALQLEIQTINKLKAERNKKSALWGLTPEESQTLNHNKQQLAKLENQLTAGQTDLKDESREKITQNMKENANAAYVVASVVLLLELLLLWAYYFIWEYRATTKAEAVNFNLVEKEQKNPKAEHNTVTLEPNKTEVDKLAGLVAQLLQQQQQPNVLQITNNTPANPPKIGYTFAQNSENFKKTTELKVESSKTEGSNRTCLHCGTQFQYRIHNQKYCSDKCRMEAWQIKTGKVVGTKKKK